MENAVEVLRNTGIIPVIKLEESEKAVPLAQALLSGGIPAAEVTFRTKTAAKSIESMAKALPQMFVCAGTVLTVEQAKEAIGSGAKAVISPGLNPKVVEYCLSVNVPVYPGCATPTEVETALSLGLDTVKLFPAQVVGGVKMLKALYGPYPQVRFMPTGGISTQNVVEYLSQPNVIACGGSWLCPQGALDKENWEEIASIAKTSAELVKEARK